MYPLHFDQTICRLLYLGLSIILRQHNYRASLVGPRLLHLRFFATKYTFTYTRKQPFHILRFNGTLAVATTKPR